MSDEHSMSDWDEDDDNEQTVVVENPLRRTQQPPAAEEARAHGRALSSFAPPRAGRVSGAEGRPSLYDRLVQSGALDEVLESAAAEAPPFSEPVSVARTAMPSRSVEMPPPPDLGDLAVDLELDPERESFEPFALRDSVEELRESDIDVLGADTRSFGSEPALALPPPPPAVAAPMPSIMLGPGTSMRNDATERFSLMPPTHPLANTLTPPANNLSAPPARRLGVLWMAFAAVALVGVGVALGRLAQPQLVQVATSAQPVPEVATIAQTAAIATVPAVSNEALAAPAPMPVMPSAPQAEAPVGDVEPNEEPPSADDADEERRASRRARERRARAPEGGADSSPVASVAAPTPAGGVAPSPAVVPAPRSAPAQPAADLPAQPSREVVVNVMNGMLPKLQACVGDKHGAAHVTLTVRSTGNVTYALVGGVFAGTAEGSCIAREIKTAEFPAFTDPSIRVAYPLQL